MTKKTKKIILWVAGIWFASMFFFGMLSVFFDNMREGSAEPQQVLEQVEDVVDVQDDSLLLMRCKALYEELMEMKERPTFKEYGFSEAGPHKTG